MRLTPNEVGLIPADWEVRRLGDVSRQITNGFVGVATPFYADEETGVRYLLGTNIRPNKITSELTTYVTREFSERNAKSVLQEGDLLTVQSGHIGVSAVVSKEHSNSNCHALIITRLDRDTALPEFICQYLNSELGKTRLRGLHVGSSVPHINTSELAEFRVPLPPLGEQIRMVEIWRHWDMTISAIEKLLANSRRQKHDLMQGLLTGHRGFGPAKSSWEQPDFDEVFERIARKNTLGDQNVLTISGQHGLISQRDFFKKSVASENLTGYTLLERGDFAYNKSYSAGYPVGAIKPLLAYESGVVSSLYICFRIRRDVEASADFFRHYFEGGMLNDAISGIAQEGARNHGLLNVSVKDFFKLKLRVPAIETQRRIAEVLNAAESEERCMQQQLANLKQEKLALMTDLLTGKRRVCSPEATVEPEAA